MEKEAKTVNFGLTEEVMEYLDKMNEKYVNKGEKEEKPGNEVKRIICDIAKEETWKIKERLSKLDKDDTGNDEWIKLIRALDNVKEVIAYM